MARLVRAYTVAAAVVVTAFLIARLVWPLIEPTPSPLFLAAAVVSAWYGGLGPGLFATAIAVLTKAHFFLPAMYPFDVDDLPTLVCLLVFALVAVLISSLTGALRLAATVNGALAARERVAGARAEADNRAKDVFLAKVSHELRTQLQAMSTWPHLLGRTRLGDRAFGEALAAMHREVAAQSRLISDLLVVSRIIAGKADVAMEPVMLQPVVEAAVATTTAAALLPQPTVHITADDPSTGPGLGDRGAPRAPGNHRPPHRARHGVWYRERHAAVPVLEFWQGSKSGHRSSGLGLAIVRHLVELHGGTVRADSTGPGCGTTFVIELPLAERHAAWAVAIATVEETSRSPRELVTRDGDHSVVEAP
jgi:signal transduction histidine kinase